MTRMTRLWSWLRGEQAQRAAGTQAKLCERNARLNAALNNMSQGLCMFDADERVVVLNLRFLEIYQLSPEVVRPGCTLIELLRHRRAVGVLPTDPDVFYAALKRDLAKGRSTELLHETHDGRFILAHNQPMPGGGWVTTHEDVTERRKAEAAVRDQKLQIDVALNNMSAGLCMFDAQQRLILCNRRYLEMYGFTEADATPGRTLWELIALRNQRGHYLQDPSYYADRLKAAFATRQPINFTTEMPDGRTIEIANIPMADGGWVATHEDVTEKRRTEERLREQKLQLDIALDNMAHGLCMFDAQARLMFCNRRYTQMYGMADDDVTPGITLIALLEKRRALGTWARDPHEYLAELTGALAKGETFTFTVEGPGDKVISIFNRPMPDGRWVSCHEDITERRKAERQVLEQKRRLDAAIQNMSQGLCMFDADGRMLLFNPRYAEMMQVSPESLQNCTLAELMARRKAMGEFYGDPDEFANSVRDAMRDGKEVTRTIERSDGRVHQIVLRPMPAGGWVTTLEDVTERRIVQERLREQKLRLDAALNNMSQGLNMFDAEGRLLLCNERYMEMYRLTADEVKPGRTMRELVEARVANGTFFATDPDAYTASLLKWMRNQEPNRIELDLPDGRVIAVISRPTAEGNGWVVTHEDITERRRAEKERDRSHLFANTVIENVPATIVVKDAHTLRYVMVNRAGEAYFGSQRETMIGKTSDDIFPPETAALIREHDEDLLRTGQAQFYDEHPTNTPGAGPRIVTTARMPIRDEQGEVQYLLTVIEDRTNRKRAEAQIAHMAHHDPLTGLPNRAAFNECLAATIEGAGKDGSSFALMSLDIDRFKEINDVFGHVIGDDLLCEIARRVQAAAAGAFVARLGGDEFVIIANDGDQPSGAELTARNIIATIADEFTIDGHQLHSGISIGIAIFPANAQDAEALIANADAALYRAKSEGRGIYRFFEATMDERLRERRALQQDLQAAIERNELILNYQPQARIDGQRFGFEALARWRHPTRGLISPGKFIPLAEESGLIIPLGEWILREACREAASWAKPLQIAINLSPVQFRHGDLAALVHSILLETGLSPSRLELEITEGVLIGDFSRALSTLRRLKALGVRIAMDDFGTGYSSLSYLQSFPFDKIKIDREFVMNLGRNTQSAAIIRAVIGLGHGLDVPIVAEGVETQEQLSFLASESCDQVQGYFIGKPAPIQQYAELVGRERVADGIRKIS
jgi:diguanylate cyclase (GGDEF)-like protein/PAS domain S-box-containing protein